MCRHRLNSYWTAGWETGVSISRIVYIASGFAFIHRCRQKLITILRRSKSAFYRKLTLPNRHNVKSVDRSSILAVILTLQSISISERDGKCLIFSYYKNIIYILFICIFFFLGFVIIGYHLSPSCLSVRPYYSLSNITPFFFHFFIYHSDHVLF